MFTQRPTLEMEFDEVEVPFGEIIDTSDVAENLEPAKLDLWKKRQMGDLDLAEINGREYDKPNTQFSSKFIYVHKIGNTVTAHNQCVLFDRPRHPNKSEVLSQGTFPIDYDFIGMNHDYLIGMSVPPVMTAQVATRIHEQWLSKINA
jgi:DNA (cytosine-5)-methyltransferase 1